MTSLYHGVSKCSWCWFIDINIRMVHCIWQMSRPHLSTLLKYLPTYNCTLTHLLIYMSGVGEGMDSTLGLWWNCPPCDSDALTMLTHCAYLHWGILTLKLVIKIVVNPGESEEFWQPNFSCDRTLPMVCWLSSPPWGVILQVVCRLLDNDSVRGLTLIL